jgi:hypothetical protein
VVDVEILMGRSSRARNMTRAGSPSARASSK